MERHDSLSHSETIQLKTSQENQNLRDKGIQPKPVGETVESAPVTDDSFLPAEPETEAAGGDFNRSVAVMEFPEDRPRPGQDTEGTSWPPDHSPIDTQDRPTVQSKDQQCTEKCPESTNHPLKGRALKAYSHQTRQIREDQLIVTYLPLVHRIVQQVTSYLQPPLSREDLVSAGTIGLVKAARDYDPAHQTEFKTYAYIRIRGAILDELRSWSFAPSNFKKQFDQAQHVMQEMAGEDGELPSDTDLAGKLQMPVDKMYRMFENARARHFLSIHGLSDETPALGESLAAPTAEPGDRIEQEELVEKLAQAIQKLPMKQRRIIILYYTRELTMKQIATTMEITESRVSQLHASALVKLASRLKAWRDSMD